MRADPAAVTIRQALADAELLTSPTDVRNAPLVLVVLPPGDEGAAESLATKTILAGLVNGLAANAAGVVVTGDTESAADGELAALRASELVGAISTVDGLETTIGQVTTVLALTSVALGHRRLLRSVGRRRAGPARLDGTTSGRAARNVREPEDVP